MLPILWRRRAAQRLMADGRKNNVKTSLFLFFFPLPYISLNSLKDCLASAISRNAWATLKTNCLLSPHTHTHTLILSFSYTDLFTFLSLMQQLVYICFSSLTCSLFSLHPSPSHIYTSLFTHHCVPSLIPPFENHLIRKACEAHMSSPPLPPPPHTPPVIPLFFFRHQTLLSFFSCILLVFFNLVSLRALPN